MRKSRSGLAKASLTAGDSFSVPGLVRGVMLIGVFLHETAVAAKLPDLMFQQLNRVDAIF